jgi:polyhydroxyalkanoate synthase subunit PhaC
MTHPSASLDPFAQSFTWLQNLTKVMTTKAAIAQTPKEMVWSLNKAKLYRYVPVVSARQRHPVPLLLVFALMNRPYILDLRPGHSFVE